MRTYRENAAERASAGWHAAPKGAVLWGFYCRHCKHVSTARSGIVCKHVLNEFSTELDARCKRIEPRGKK